MATLAILAAPSPAKKENHPGLWPPPSCIGYLAICPPADVFKHKFDVVYKETDGAHTWDNWRDYLREFAPQLFQ